MSTDSFLITPALSAGFSAGCLLAVARPAVGSTPHLLQDFVCPMIGALAGEIIGGGGVLLLGAIAAKKSKDPTGFAAVGFAAILAGGVGITVGTVAGVVTSIGLSYFNG